MLGGLFIRRELYFQNYQETLSEDQNFLIIYTLFQQLCLHYTECDGGDGGTQQNAQEGTHRNGVKSFLWKHSNFHESTFSREKYSIFVL